MLKKMAPALLLTLALAAGNASAGSVELSNGKIGMTVDGFSIKSVKIDGKERLIGGGAGLSAPGIALRVGDKYYAPSEITVKEAKSSGNSYEVAGEAGGVSAKAKIQPADGTLKISLEFSSDDSKPHCGILTLPTNYDEIDYFRYDEQAFKERKAKGQIDINTVEPGANFYQMKRAGGFGKFSFRQPPVVVMNYEDKHYLSIEREADENLEAYSPVFLEGKGNEDAALGLIMEMPSSFSQNGKLTEKAVIALRANSYNCLFFDQALLDARKSPSKSPLPLDSVFDISHSAIPKGLAPSNRMVVFSWGERDMCFDASPSESYKKIRDSIIEAKKQYPNSKMLLYWSPTLFFKEDIPGYHYPEEKKRKYLDGGIKDAEGKRVGLLYHGRVFNYYQNMDPELPYGREVLENVARLFKEIPEADGLFWDNFYYGTLSYGDDWDYEHKSSSLAKMVKFIKALKAIPEMKTKLICANGALEPNTARLIDCYLSESFPRGVAALYPQRFGKPVYFLRKLGVLSLSESRFWNIYPNGSYVTGKFPFNCDAAAWPKPVDCNGTLISPFAIYYPEAHRYVAWAKKYTLWDDAPGPLIKEDRPHTLKELGLELTGGEKPPFYIEYFHSPTSEITAFQKYSLRRSFVEKYEDVALQPHISATLEPLNLEVKAAYEDKSGERRFLITPRHKGAALNCEELSIEGVKDGKPVYKAEGKYISHNGMEGFFVKGAPCDEVDSLTIRLSNERGETIARSAPFKEFARGANLFSLKAEGQEGATTEAEIERIKGLLQKAKPDSPDLLNISKWQPSSARITMSDAGGILKISHMPGTLYRWDRVEQYFTRHPGADWSQYKGIEIWLYPANDDFKKASFWMLHSHGHVKGKESIDKTFDLKPNEWNKVRIDFADYKFNLKDVWALALTLDSDNYKRKDVRHELFIGGMDLLK